MANQSVSYEWDVEEVTSIETEMYEEGEVLDHNFTESYEECKKIASRKAPQGIRFEIVLVRDTEDSRSWAYMENGKLPKYFEDASLTETRKVPLRFHKEVDAS
jgi:hypothetical protein